MWRSLHSVLGLASMVLILALALSGAMLSVFPVLDAFAPQVQPTAGITVADLAGRVAAQVPGVEAIHRTPSGRIVVSYADAAGTPQKVDVDATTGQILQADTGPSAVYSALQTFHRSLFLGQGGRIVAGVGAALMALVSGFGAVLLVSRMGGWARVFGRVQGQAAGRIHSRLSRLVLLPLVLSALTGIYITLTEFDLVSVTQAESLAFPTSADTTGAPVSPSALAGLAVPLADLRDLQFPYADDPTDVFTLTTDAGLTLVDQFSGAVLEQVPATTSERVYAWFYALHTGEGMAWFGALLGLAALTVPVISGLGVAVWWRRRSGARANVPHNAAANAAEIVLLVASEGGSTWGFARTLHANLTAAGKSVHLGPMSGFRDRYDKARQVIFLAATYGNGHAPEDAGGVLRLLGDVVQPPRWQSAVLGFGDRAFAQYCQFAKDIDALVLDRGWPRLMPAAFINRQSSQAFATWGTDLGRALGLPLTLQHEAAVPPTHRLQLLSRQVYGTEVQTPTVVLRFRDTEAARRPALVRLWDWATGWTPYAPSRLLGVLPPSGHVPRFYSIASAAAQDEVEICVRKQAGGECSTYLCNLEVGDFVQAFARDNHGFVPADTRQPIIMVAAGTGIAPFVGLIRQNRRHQPFHLFWGGRSPDSDFLFASELQDRLARHELTTLATAFSRVREPAYVQDRIASQAADLRALLRQGAQIMVCGGDAMARAVRVEFETVLAPLGQSVQTLKQRGRYLEDIF